MYKIMNMKANELVDKLELVTVYDTTKDSFLHNFENERYIVIKKSESGHCCFGFSIIDTTLEHTDYSWDFEANIAECFNFDSAVKICYSLNKLNNK